jgi:ParB family transcriptional regulator, chromosome partitioning protein
VSKERRLGRGLEALLGQIPGWSGGPSPQKPAAPTGPIPGSPTPATPSSPNPSQPYGGTIGEPYAASPPSSQHPQPMYTTAPARPVAPADQAWLVAVEPEAAPPHGPAHLEIDKIESNPSQPRRDFDPRDLQSLSESISAHGLLQPVVVRQVADHYQIVAGERRLRAAKQAGWTDVPVNIIEADDRQSAELAIVENMQRKDLNALEKAASFQRYLEQYGCTQEELAGRLKMDRSTIANMIRLLELPEPVQEAVRRGKITQGHARALLPLGEENEQVAFCERIQKEGLNVRQTEATVQEMIEAADREPLTVVGADGKSTRARRGQGEHLADLEQEFRAALGLRVKITHDAKGRGKMVVHFADHDEFERLRQHVCGPTRPMVQAG